MPYKSAAQRRAMHAKAPKVAARWDKKYGGRVQKRAATRKSTRK